MFVQAHGQHSIRHARVHTEVANEGRVTPHDRVRRVLVCREDWMASHFTPKAGADVARMRRCCAPDAAEDVILPSCRSGCFARRDSRNGAHRACACIALPIYEGRARPIRIGCHAIQVRLQCAWQCGCGDIVIGDAARNLCAKCMQLSPHCSLDGSEVCPWKEVQPEFALILPRAMRIERGVHKSRHACWCTQVDSMLHWQARDVCALHRSLGRAILAKHDCNPPS